MIGWVPCDRHAASSSEAERAHRQVSGANLQSAQRASPPHQNNASTSTGAGAVPTLPTPGLCRFTSTPAHHSGDCRRARLTNSMRAVQGCGSSVAMDALPPASTVRRGLARKSSRSCFMWWCPGPAMRLVYGSIHRRRRSFEATIPAVIGAETKEGRLEASRPSCTSVFAADQLRARAPNSMPIPRTLRTRIQVPIAPMLGTTLGTAGWVPTVTLKG